MKYNLFDCHMHTNFSGDCQIPMEEMIKTAKDARLLGITITDHLDWDYYQEPGIFDLDFEAYKDAVAKMKTKYETNEFSIFWGIEIGMQKHLVDRHIKLISEYDFDFILGSIHQVDGIDPYYDKYYEKHGVLGGVRAYFEAIYENITLFDKMDSVSHLDYILRYIPKDKEKVEYLDYADIVDKILIWIIDNNKSLEINTGAFRCNLLEPNPQYKIIERYYELGGRQITLGSDAHKTEHVGLCFDKTVDELLRIGYEGITVYEQHNPKLIRF